MNNASADNRAGGSDFKMLVTGYFLLRFVLFPFGAFYIISSFILPPFSAMISLLPLFVISFKDDVPKLKPAIDAMTKAKLSRTGQSFEDTINDSLNDTFECVYKFEYAVLENVSCALKDAADYLDPTEVQKAPPMLFSCDLSKPTIYLSDTESNLNSAYPTPSP